MHQSKKEILTKLWNKKSTFNIQNNIEKEEFIENNLIVNGPESQPNINNIRKNR